MTDIEPIAALAIPEAPAIDGLLFRRLRGPEDYALMADVFNRVMRHQQIDSVLSADALREQYIHLNNCDLASDLLLAEIHGDVIAYSRVEWWDEASGDRIYLSIGHVTPEWARRGIGGAIHAHNTRRLRAIAAANPTDRPQFFQGFSWDTSVGRQELLRRDGYAPVRHAYDMVRDLSQPIGATDLPDGIEVRTPTEAEYRQVWDADVEAFRDHWGFRETTEKDYEGWRSSPFFQPAIWQVAWEGDEIVGMVQNFVNAEENATFGRQRGYTEGISVRRPWRKRGVASALINRSLAMFRAMGMAEAALGVDTENTSGALRVYEGCGFAVTKCSSTYRKPF